MRSVVAYPARLLDHYRSPGHRHRLAAATGSAHVRNPLCGDEVSMDVRVVAGVVQEAGFDGLGCAISLGAADIVAEAATGRDPAEVAGWDEAWLVARIGMVPPEGRRRCGMLGLEALQRALVDNHPPQEK